MILLAWYGMNACGPRAIQARRDINTHLAMHKDIDEGRDGNDRGCGDSRSRHCRVGNSSGFEKSRGSSFGVREITRAKVHRCSHIPVSKCLACPWCSWCFSQAHPHLCSFIEVISCSSTLTLFFWSCLPIVSWIWILYIFWVID